MPIIDKTGKKKKYKYNVTGTFIFRGSYPFDETVIAENEDEARELAEDRGLREAIAGEDLADYLDEVEDFNIEDLGEYVEPITVITPSNSINVATARFFNNPTIDTLYNQLLESQERENRARVRLRDDITLPSPTNEPLTETAPF